jgi:hypothetical protein
LGVGKSAGESVGGGWGGGVGGGQQHERHLERHLDGTSVGRWRLAGWSWCVGIGGGLVGKSVGTHWGR